MKEKIEQISREIWKLKPKSKIDFNEYFKKYEISEQNKLECYNAIMGNLKGWISVEKKYKNAIVGLPFNIPHIKNKKRIDVSDETPINKEGIKSIITILENGKPYEEVSPRTEDGMTHIGYISYDDRIMKLFRYMPFYEKDYNKNIEKIGNKDISKLNIEETKQYITYIYRKERFCEGLIKSYIDNGILLKLLKHFLEIC